MSAVDFSLRLPAALAAFSSYNDVAGVGGASAGSRYSSSINPAATAWETQQRYPVTVSGQYSGIVFDRGPTLHVLNEAATVDAGPAGAFQLAAAQVRSDQPTQGDFTLIDANYAQLQWARKFGDRFALGLNFNYTAMDTRNGAAGETFAAGHTDTYGGRVGVLGAITDRLMVGLVADYSKTPSTTTYYPPLVPDNTTFTDDTTGLLLRPGLTYKYGDQSSIYVDFQYGHYFNSTGGFVTNRVFSGIEHKFMPWFFARGGVAYDVGRAVSPTLGIGLYPSDRIAVDLGYQRNMFPTLRPEFGSSDLFGLSVSILL